MDFTKEALRVVAGHIRPTDLFSLVAFAQDALLMVASIGQAEPGRTANEPGAASRRMPTRSSDLRWMMALAGCVVPSITCATAALST